MPGIPPEPVAVIVTIPAEIGVTERFVPKSIVPAVPTTTLPSCTSTPASVDSRPIISMKSSSCAPSSRTIFVPVVAVYSDSANLDPLRYTSTKPTVYVAAKVVCPSVAT